MSYYFTFGPSLVNGSEYHLNRFVQFMNRLNGTITKSPEKSQFINLLRKLKLTAERNLDL